MANLRDRLKHIQGLKKASQLPCKETPDKGKPEKKDYLTTLSDHGWEQCGHQVVKKEVLKKTPFKTNLKLAQAVKVVIPDLAKMEFPALQDFLFFDLETTGLSGGAGTIAFLAAFGRIKSCGKSSQLKLRITQYLLLDYPGQYDFLQAVLKEFTNEESVIVSYNGKSFDSQILKNMCLMNGIRPPEYKHADLLHPARRLWKNIIGDCSQGSIETNILGLDRSGDTPGSMAPDIWFEFLKTGETKKLNGICEHNSKDIAGLCAILYAMIRIANDPLKQTDYKIDIPRLAFFWRNFLCKEKKYLLPENKEILETLIKLLTHVKDSNSYSEEINIKAERLLIIYEKRWLKQIS